MMREAAILIGVSGEVLGEHVPPGRSAVHLPDDADHEGSEIWPAIWRERDRLAGVAHAHPPGCPYPSAIDLQTFAGIEDALGKRLTWWVQAAAIAPAFVPFLVTRSIWRGPGRTNYKIEAVEPPAWCGRLHRLATT